jgi:hypothetical protein
MRFNAQFNPNSELLISPVISAGARKFTRCMICALDGMSEAVETESCLNYNLPCSPLGSRI